MQNPIRHLLNESTGQRPRSKLVTCVALSLSALTMGSVSTTNASLEVLSDMDCVIEPSITVELGSAVPGLIAENFHDRGDFVAKGTVMARLESEVERVALAIAEEIAGSSTAVDLRKLTAEFGERTQRRNEQLLTTSGVSRQVVDQVSTEAGIALLQVLQEQESQKLAVLEADRARAALNRREIRSPFDGTVVERYKTTGEYVDSDPVYQIAQLDPLNVEVIVPVEYLGSLQAGTNAAVSLTLPGFEDRIMTAQVTRVDAVADAASSTYGVRLTLPNPDLTIPSGVRCQVDFLSS